jgi:alpha-L-fucosidase 2
MLSEMIGCAHSQQLIWQLFNAVVKGFTASGDIDTAFLEGSSLTAHLDPHGLNVDYTEVKTKRAQMDKGLRIGSWGQLQGPQFSFSQPSLAERRFAEWKVDKDSPTDKHRHLSHLIGLYPGYALATYDEATQGGLIVNGSRTTYTKKQLIDAATVSLRHRGKGTGPDANSGWEKVWRAAAWAQLGNAEEFYHELSVSPLFPMLVRQALTFFSMELMSILDRTCLVCMMQPTPTPFSRLTPTWHIRVHSL